MKILLFCCKGFEMMEFAPFIDVMGWAKNDFGISIEVVTAGFEKTVLSAFGIPITVDQTFEEIVVDAYDALVIPGGFEEYGFYEDAFNDRLMHLIRQFSERGKWIASVCVGALPLGASGILRGRKATTYHLGDGRRQKQLASFGANVISDQEIVVDDHIITSFCPETAPGVAFKLLGLMTDESTSHTVAAAMGFSLQ
ncbi:MAG: DJ-1/PfpI family protein [Clostridiales bacterium]|nr:DJ-1/PfpI family protein [Clostridiales bacterium]